MRLEQAAWVSLAVGFVLASGVVPRDARAQSARKKFETGITGSAPGGPSNPTTMMNDPAVRRLILRLVDHALPIEEAEEELAGQTYTLKALVEAGLARVDDGDGSVQLALNYLSADDQRLISSKARVYGRELSESILGHRREIESAVAPLAATAGERRAILFFLVGCVALDWDGLGYTLKAGYRAGPTVQGSGFAYTPWMKENAPDISRRGLYWGSHNAAASAYTLTTFGDHDALPRVALPDLFFRTGNPFPTLETSDGAAAGRRLLAAYSGAILSDVASVLVAIDDGARDADRIAAASGVTATRVGAVLSLLETVHYVLHDADGYVSQVTILKDDAKPASERVVSIVRDAIDAWHRRRYADVTRELRGLTALRQGVPFAVLYTEIWHYVFGYANLYLSRRGLVADPYAEGAPFRGFLPFLWAASVDVSS